MALRELCLRHLHRGRLHRPRQRWRVDVSRRPRLWLACKWPDPRPPPWRQSGPRPSREPQPCGSYQSGPLPRLHTRSLAYLSSPVRTQITGPDASQEARQTVGAVNHIRRMTWLCSASRRGPEVVDVEHEDLVSGRDHEFVGGEPKRWPWARLGSSWPRCDVRCGGTSTASSAMAGRAFAPARPYPRFRSGDRWAHLPESANARGPAMS